MSSKGAHSDARNAQCPLLASKIVGSAGSARDRRQSVQGAESNGLDVRGLDVGAVAARRCLLFPKESDLVRLVQARGLRHE